MLSLEKGAKHPNGGEGGFSVVKDDGIWVCKLEEWALGCCGIHALSGLYTNPDWWTTKNIDKLIKFFDSEGSWCHTGYRAKEFYISLSSSQAAQSYYKHLISHPNVKLVDGFVNKAHGPNDIFLYRLSINGDFKKCPQ